MKQSLATVGPAVHLWAIIRRYSDKGVIKFAPCVERINNLADVDVDFDDIVLLGEFRSTGPRKCFSRTVIRMDLNESVAAAKRLVALGQFADPLDGIAFQLRISLVHLFWGRNGVDLLPRAISQAIDQVPISME
ncbi:MAG: hypothetical protein R8G34_18950 [Paracoccaceae bacterium]|nr:hypothetical protein [Paracoccaceae bacterium]